MARPTLEVAVASLRDALAAIAAGADRLELCTALDAGGLTPSLGLFQEVRARVAAPTFVLLRPRAGGFVYREEERSVMLRDLALFRELGADGFVSGVLDEKSQVASGACRQLLDAARPRPVVFHRAFDLVGDMPAALEKLIDLGFARVLTSGGMASACEGIETIRQLRLQAGGRIEILPGGGVTPNNVTRLLRATGCTQVHASARRWLPDADIESERFGFGRFQETDAHQVRLLRQEVDALISKP